MWGVNNGFSSGTSQAPFESGRRVLDAGSDAVFEPDAGQGETVQPEAEAEDVQLSRHPQLLRLSGVSQLKSLIARFLNLGASLSWIQEHSTLPLNYLIDDWLLRETGKLEIFQFRRIGVLLLMCT